MADRSRRMRRQISDTPDEPSEQSASESEQEWDVKRADSARRAGKNEILKASNGGKAKKADDTKQSIKLTMKVAPSKLREVMRANEVDSLQDTLGGGQVIVGPRNRRAAAAAASAASTTANNGGRNTPRPKYAEYGESDIEDEEEDEEEEEDDAEAEDDDANDFDEQEGGDDEDEDVEMEDAPPPPPPQPTRKPPPQPKPPKITLKPPPAQAKPGTKSKIVVTPAPVGPLKTVEEQEIDDEMADDDEVSSELSEGEGEGATTLMEDEGEVLLDEEDLEGEDIEDDDDDDLDDSDDGTPASGTATPDLAKMTKRQRAIDEGGLMALDMAPQQRKFFTDEEKAMKKDEHARKRKELTKRKINEEKTAALNRLLKPQASKARGAAPKPETLAAATAAAAAEGTSGASFTSEIYEKPDPLFTRWVSTREGVRLGVPEEWLGKRAGRMFGPPNTGVGGGSGGVLVQEIG